MAYKRVWGQSCPVRAQLAHRLPRPRPISRSLEKNAGASEYTGAGVGKSGRVAGAPQRGNEGDPCFPSAGVPPWAGRLRAFPKSGKEALLLAVGANGIYSPPWAFYPLHAPSRAFREEHLIGKK